MNPVTHTEPDSRMFLRDLLSRWYRLSSEGEN